MTATQEIAKLRAALQEARLWNNSDIRNIDEVTPNLPMLQARRRVITKALKVDK